MFKSCKYCGGIHDYNYVCPAKPPRKYKKRDSKIDKYRKTTAWQEVRAQAIARDRGLCRVCFPAVLTNRGISVHHITPIAEDWSRRDDIDNLICLCTFHHRLAEEGEIKRAELYELAGIPPEDFLKKI